MTLLDIGCGWGSAMKRAIEKHDVNVVGLTLSRNQCRLLPALLEQIDTDRSRRVFLRGWEQFDEPVDRIVSIEAFEAFRKPATRRSSRRATASCPTDGRMVLETIFTPSAELWPEHGIPITMSDLKFMRFIAKEIFPGGCHPLDGHRRILPRRRVFAGAHATHERALRPDARHLGGESGGAIATTPSPRRPSRSTSATCVT